MNEQNESPDPVAQLLRKAGKRPAPPADMAARVRAQVRAEWQQGVSRRRQRRFMAIAASVIAAVAAGWLLLQVDSTRPTTLVAHIQDGSRVIAVGEHVETGAGEGMVLVASPDVRGAGVTLRLAPGSAVAWIASQEMQLLRGQVYIDSDTAPANMRTLVVDAGSIRIEHVGTRYVASVDGRSLNVIVRDGTVKLQAGKREALLHQGEQGLLDLRAPDVDQIVRTAVAPSGASWSWVDALAPPIAIENVDLHSVLVRLAHESGLTVEYASSSVETAAHATVLHGPTLKLPPNQALQAVVVTTSFIAEPTQEGTVLISAR